MRLVSKNAQSANTIGSFGKLKTNFMNTEPKSIDLEALSQLLDLDIAADAARPQKEIDDELKRRGLNPDELNRNAVEALRNALGDEIAPVAASPSVVERFGEAIADGIKQLLSEFRNESFVAAHLGDDVAPADTDVVRVITLADCPGLRQRLPWLGGVLRVYQQERRSDQSTAKYVAFVETLNVEPNQQNGELKVVLTANGGKCSEVFLSFDYSSCEFPVRLPADESQLTLECYANNIA
jgi:hypothetical protein